MKFKYFYLILIPVVVGTLLFSAFSSQDDPGKTPESNAKIIKFSHSFHSEITDCASCHTTVDSSTTLTDRLLPNMESCAQCHDVEDDKNCTQCHYEDVFEPLVQKKSDLNFSHKLHVTEKKVECQTCHQGVTKVDYAFKAEKVFPDMETCFTCHGATKAAPNECSTCHTSTVNLIPQSHKSASFINNHKFAANAFNANCVMCHDNNSCEECHVATTMITENNTADNFYQPYAPTNSTKGAKQQQITRVHSLDYVYNHGIDAKGKVDNCRTCHQVETFCVKCHNSEEHDFAMGGIMPMSHLDKNFMTVGVGTGGGEHATLARRDIESCVSCHDVQGADPTCIKCHMDPDGIKGTNPKTHPANFMKDTHGDWHDSYGSICYNCHTSASPQTPAGTGFCGYCHGAKAH